MAGEPFEPRVRSRRTAAALIGALVLGHGACAAQERGCFPLRPAGGNARYSLAASAADSVAVRDMRRGLEAALVRIPADLGQPLRHRIDIEVYPSQACYDRHVPNEHSRGTPAVSFDRRIFMVSPRAAIRVQGIPYAARLEFVDHEIAHLVLNEMNPDLPMWLVEGVPTFEGSRSVYVEVGRRYLGRQIPVPSFERLARNYGDVTGADVLAFTAVQYIVERFGQARLNRLIREPGSLEAILGVPAADFDRGWREFVRSRYVAAPAAAGARR